MKKNIPYSTHYIQKFGGFTLIEMLLYVAIISILITAMISFSWDAIYGGVRSSTEQEVNQNTRLAAKRILYEIRNASGVNIVSGSTLNLSSSDSSRNPTVIDVSGGRLRIGYGASGPCPTSSPCYLTSNQVTVSNLIFTNLSSSPYENIKFSITVEATGGVQEFNKSETFIGAGEVRSN